MKIMFNIPSLGKGGAERVVSTLANNMINTEDISILVNTTKNISYSLDSHIKTFELDKKKYTNPLIRNIYRIIGTKKIIKKIKPDIIITFLPLPSYRVLFLKPLLKCKIIVSDRNNPQIEYKTVINKVLMKWLYKRADGFVFQTIEQQKYFIKKIQDKSIIIPNPLKNEFLDINKVKKEKTVITVGRLVAQKNQKLLIDAFKELPPKFNEYKLKIYGEGNLKDELQKYIDEQELSEKVFLCGVTDNIKNELLKSTLFVLSSDYEGMPNALIEAMACGLPCISSNCPCGGPRELISDGNNGFLFEINNKEELKKKIGQILNDEKLQNKFSTNALLIAKLLDPKTISNKWLEYIKVIVNDKK